jgi:hypothetical protein
MLLCSSLVPVLPAADQPPAPAAAQVATDFPAGGTVWLPNTPEAMPLVDLYPQALVWSADSRAVLYARAAAQVPGLRIYRLDYAPHHALESTLLVDDPHATAPTRLFALQRGVVACFSEQGLALIDSPGTPQAHLRIVCADARQPLASPDGRWLAYLHVLPQDQGHGDDQQLHLLSADGSDQIIPIAPPPAVGERAVTYVESWDHQFLHLSHGTCRRDQLSQFADPQPWICDAASGSCHPDHPGMVFAIGSDPGGPRAAWPLRWALPAGRVLTCPDSDQPQPRLQPPPGSESGPQAATRLSAQLILGPQPGGPAPISIAVGAAAAQGDLLPRAVDASGTWILSAVFHTWRYEQGVPWGSWLPEVQGYALTDVAHGVVQALPDFTISYWPERGEVLVLPAAQELLVVDPHPTLFYSPGRVNPHHGLWSCRFTGGWKEVGAAAGLHGAWDASEPVGYPLIGADRLALVVDLDRSEHAPDAHRLLVFWRHAQPLTVLTSHGEADLPGHPTWSPDGQLLALSSGTQVGIWEPHDAATIRSGDRDSAPAPAPPRRP